MFCRPTLEKQSFPQDAGFGSVEQFVPQIISLGMVGGPFLVFVGANNQPFVSYPGGHMMPVVLVIF